MNKNEVTKAEAYDRMLPVFEELKDRCNAFIVAAESAKYVNFSIRMGKSFAQLRQALSHVKELEGK